MVSLGPIGVPYATLATQNDTEFDSTTDCVLLTDTCAVVGYNFNGGVRPKFTQDYYVRIINPQTGIVTRTFATPVPQATGVEFTFSFLPPLGIMRLSDTEFGFVVNVEGNPWSYYFARYTVTGRKIRDRQYFLTTGEPVHQQDTGGSYFHPKTHVYEFMYWTRYFDLPRYTFTAWRLSLNFDTFAVSDHKPIYPNMGLNPMERAVGYYSTLPIPQLGGAIGAVPGGKPITGGGTPSFSTLNVVDNFGRVLDTLPEDLSGGYLLTDRFMTQVDGGTTDVALLYTFWHPDIVDPYAPDYDKRPGWYEIRLRRYQLEPEFAVVGGDLLLGSAYIGYNFGFPPSPTAEKLLTVPYDYGRFITDYGRIGLEDFGAPESILRGPNTADDQMNIAVQSTYVDGPVGESSLGVTDHFKVNTLGRPTDSSGFGAISSLGNLLLYATTVAADDHFRPGTKVHHVVQLFGASVATTRLNQRDDGHGIHAHPRLNPSGALPNRPASVQNAHAPRLVQSPNTYS